MVIIIMVVILHPQVIITIITIIINITIITTVATIAVIKSKVIITIIKIRHNHLLLENNNITAASIQALQQQILVLVWVICSMVLQELRMVEWDIHFLFLWG